MVIREPFDPWPQNDEPWFVPREVRREIATGLPDVVRVGVDGCEDIEQMLDVYVLRRDPPCFSEVKLFWVMID